MKYLLIGIGGVYNYGCEAIIRGTYNIIKSANPDAEITYASYNYEYDTKRLKDLDIEIVERYHIKRWSYRNVIRKLLSYINIHYPIPFDNPKAFRGYDYVLSIGGDMYTLDQYGEFDAGLPIFLEKLRKQGCKYILWGCSVGPFEKNPNALKFFSAHLEKIDKIIAREMVTVNYLKSLGIKKTVVFAPDPAFMVEGPKRIKGNNRKKKLTIGINLSPLSALYEYNNVDVAIEEHAKCVERIVKEYDAHIIFLPHVISKTDSDNDLDYLEKVKRGISDEIKDKVSIVDTDPGFVGLKKELLKCDIVLAARMHCAINAITSGVPALFMSYSSKAYGMSKMVYNHGGGVITLKEFTDFDKLREKINTLINIQIDIESIQLFNYSKIINGI